MLVTSLATLAVATAVSGCADEAREAAERRPAGVPVSPTPDRTETGRTTDDAPRDERRAPRRGPVPNRATTVAGAERGGDLDRPPLGLGPRRARAAVEATVTTVYAALRDVASRSAPLEGARLCGLMTRAARARLVEYVADQTHVREGLACASATQLLVDRSKRLGGLEGTLGVEVVGVNVRGSRATASVRLGRRRPVAAIGLALEDGRWKLADTPGGG